MTRRRSDERDRERREASLAWLARYDGLWDDSRAFRAALEEPPPIDLLVPPGGRALADVRASIAARGDVTRTFAWAPHHLRVKTARGPGTLPEVVLGDAFPQGVVSSLPPRVLGPRPGQLLLDACAAPGGKTLLLATAAGHSARVLASDLIAGRAGMLVQVLARHGVDSAVVVRQDASQMPLAAAFDGVLLDAPCSGEGTFRLPRMRFEPSGEQGLARAAATQRRLLERMLHLLAPGGRLVYATCTYAPEENEAVLTDVLAGRADVDVIELPPGLPGQPGLRSWRGRAFDPRLVRALRLGPQHTGSWGFFVALLAKDAAAEAPRRPSRYGEPVPPRDEPDARRIATAYFETRFGIAPDDLGQSLFTVRGRDIWSLSRREAGKEDVDLARLHVVAPGLRVVRRARRGPRATTAALRAFGALMTENVVDVTADDVIAGLDGARPLPAPGAFDGQVALRVAGRVVAGGHARDGRCLVELPKAWR